MYKNSMKSETKYISSEIYYLIRYIAIITMFIDHLGRVLYDTNIIKYSTFMIFISVGRLAFPLFCYLLVESFYFTQNKMKHLKRIGFLFVISELPHDIIMTSTNPLSLTTNALTHQNTCSTLFLGFLMLCINLFLDKNTKGKSACITKLCFKSSLIFFFSIVSIWLKLDYSYYGVILIFLLNVAKLNKHSTLIRIFAFALFGVLTFTPVYVLTLIYILSFLCIFEIFSFMHISKTQKLKSLYARFLKLITGNISKKICSYFYPLHFYLLVIIKVILN